MLAAMTRTVFVVTTIIIVIIGYLLGRIHNDGSDGSVVEGSKVCPADSSVISAVDHSLFKCCTQDGVMLFEIERLFKAGYALKNPAWSQAIGEVLHQDAVTSTQYEYTCFTKLEMDYDSREEYSISELAQCLSSDNCVNNDPLWRIIDTIDIISLGNLGDIMNNWEGIQNDFTSIQFVLDNAPKLVKFFNNYNLLLENAQRPGMTDLFSSIVVEGKDNPTAFFYPSFFAQDINTMPIGSVIHYTIREDCYNSDEDPESFCQHIQAQSSNQYNYQGYFPWTIPSEKDGTVKLQLVKHNYKPWSIDTVFTIARDSQFRYTMMESNTYLFTAFDMLMPIMFSLYPDDEGLMIGLVQYQPKSFQSLFTDVHDELPIRHVFISQKVNQAVLPNKKTLTTSTANVSFTAQSFRMFPINYDIYNVKDNPELLFSYPLFNIYLNVYTYELRQAQLMWFESADAVKSYLGEKLHEYLNDMSDQGGLGSMFSMIMGDMGGVMSRVLNLESAAIQYSMVDLNVSGSLMPGYRGNAMAFNIEYNLDENKPFDFNDKFGLWSNAYISTPSAPPRTLPPVEISKGDDDVILTISLEIDTKHPVKLAVIPGLITMSIKQVDGSPSIADFSMDQFDTEFVPCLLGSNFSLPMTLTFKLQGFTVGGITPIIQTPGSFRFQRNGMQQIYTPAWGKIIINEDTGRWTTEWTAPDPFGYTICGRYEVAIFNFNPTPVDRTKLLFCLDKNGNPLPFPKLCQLRDCACYCYTGDLPITDSSCFLPNNPFDQLSKYITHSMTEEVDYDSLSELVHFYTQDFSIHNGVNFTRPNDYAKATWPDFYWDPNPEYYHLINNMSVETLDLVRVRTIFQKNSADFEITSDSEVMDYYAAIAGLAIDIVEVKKLTDLSRRLTYIEDVTAPTLWSTLSSVTNIASAFIKSASVLSAIGKAQAVFDTMDSLSRDHSVQGTVESIAFGLLGVHSIRQYGKEKVPDLYTSAKNKFAHVYSGIKGDAKVSKQVSSLVQLAKSNTNVPSFLREGKSFVPHPELKHIKDSNYIEVDGKIIKVGGVASRGAYALFQKMKNNKVFRGMASKIENANLTPDHSGVNIRQTWPLDEDHKLFMHARIGIGESMSSNRNGISLGFAKIKDGLPSGPSINMVHGKVDKNGVLNYVAAPEAYASEERLGMLIQHGLSKADYQKLKDGTATPAEIMPQFSTRDLWGKTVERSMTIPNSIKRSHNVDLDANQIEYILKEMNTESWSKGFMYDPIKNNCHMFANDFVDSVLGIPSNKFPHSFSSLMHDRVSTTATEYWKMMAYHWTNSLQHYRPGYDATMFH